MEQETQLALVILAVEDLARAVGFYRQAFGWRQRVDAPVYAELELPGGMRLGLYQRESFGANTGRPPHAIPQGALAPTELYFRPADMDAAIARLEGAGGRLPSARAPRGWGDEAAYYADPDGNVLVLARPLAA